MTQFKIIITCIVPCSSSLHNYQAFYIIKRRLMPFKLSLKASLILMQEVECSGMLGGSEKNVNEC